MLKHHWPAIGAALALGLFLAAAAVYPGGTAQSTTTVGFRWGENFVCALFGATALNGEHNPARPLAIPALLLMCLSLGTVFWRISRRANTRLHRSAIEIGGPGAMAYGVFVVTPIHNLVVNIGTVFLSVALAATTHMLFVQRQRLLAAWGGLCIAQLVLSATLYHLDRLDGLLPLQQKLDWLTLVGWLFAIHYSPRRQ